MPEAVEISLRIAEKVLRSWGCAESEVARLIDDIRAEDGAPAEDEEAGEEAKKDGEKQDTS